MDFNSNEGATSGATMHGILVIVLNLNSRISFNDFPSGLRTYGNEFTFSSHLSISFKPLGV